MSGQQLFERLRVALGLEWCAEDDDWLRSACLLQVKTRLLEITVFTCDDISKSDWFGNKRQDPIDEQLESAINVNIYPDPFGRTQYQSLATNLWILSL